MFYSKKLIEAFTYAMDLHQNQKKMEQPIMSHILDVVSLILYFGGDEDAAIAGMLHDTHERAKKSLLAEIEQTFNAHVAEIVRVCSNSNELSWKAQKQMRIDALTSVEKSALLVSACEVLSNMKRLLFRLHGAKNKGQVLTYLKANGGIDGKLWYYRTFSDALYKRREYPELAYEMKISIRELETLIY